MNPIQRTMLTVSVFVLSFFLCWGGAHGMEKPEIVRLDAHYTANVVKISVHWQSANPVSVVQAIVGGEAHEIRVDPYDNRRNPDGYSGEAEILVNASPGAVGAGIPYVVQIEDDLRQKSEQVTGLLRTAAAGAAGGGGAGRGSDAFGTGTSGTDFQTDAGTQSGFQTMEDQWNRAKQGQPGDLIDTILGLATGNASGGGGQGNASGAQILQNDSGNVLGFLSDLNPGDEVAVLLGDLGRPFTVNKVYLLMGGSTDKGFVTLRIYEGTGTPGNLQERYSTSVEIPGSDDKLSELDLAAYGVAVPIQTGSVWVSLEMGHAGFPGVGVDTSTNAVPGRNYIRRSGSWKDFVSDQLPNANAIIRVEVQ